jgi:hypothetical protein
MNLIENLDGLEPTNYHEASQDPKWTVAMEQEKIQSLKWKLGSMLIYPRKVTYISKMDLSNQMRWK